MLTMEKKGVDKKIFSYACLTAVSILIFMWENYIKTGDVLHALNSSDREVYAFLARYPMQGLWQRVSPTFDAFMGYSIFWEAGGAILALIKKRNVFVIILFLIAYFFPIYKILNNSLHNSYRYFTTRVIFSYILAGHAIYFLVYRLKIPALIIISLVISCKKKFSIIENNCPLFLRFSDNYRILIKTITKLNKTRELIFFRYGAKVFT